MILTFDRCLLSWNAILSTTLRQRMKKMKEDRERWIKYLIEAAPSLPYKPFKHPVGLDIFCTGKRRRDCDNLVSKTLIDAMRMVEILEDDYSDQVVWVKLQYRVDRKYSTMLTVYPEK